MNSIHGSAEGHRSNRCGWGTILIAVTVLSLFIWAGLAVKTLRGQDSSDTLAQPEHHFRIENPANLSAAEAEVIYERILERMGAAYHRSKNPAANEYNGWRRYNSAPYLSATHGNRYVNNYANAVASQYGAARDGAAMPPGSIIAKDSFTVTRMGDVFTGALFIMEKMPQGFSLETSDWRYTMVLPDGTILGTSKGEGAENVEFCGACHREAGTARDHLFFVPKEYQVEFLDPPIESD